MTMNDEVTEGVPIPRIMYAAPADERTVTVTWETKATQTIDLMPAFNSSRQMIRLRSDDALFRSFSVSEKGDALVWPDGSVLSAERLEHLAPVGMTNHEFRDAMAKLEMSLDGMAGRLGIARRLVADYRMRKSIPTVVAFATRYLLLTQVSERGRE